MTALPNVNPPVTGNPPAPTVIPLKGLRGSIARNMTEGWKAPRVGMGMDVDMTTALTRLKELQSEVGTQRLTVTAFMLRAVALALKAHPRMNAFLREGGIELAPQVNLGVAVSVENGLMVPVIVRADELSLVDLAGQMRKLAEAARSGALPPKAYQGGTFTVTNLGMTGIDWFTPILNPPQVGILGVSRVVDKPVAKEREIVVAPMTTLTLVFDHRAVDGYPAALFLAEVKQRLESRGQG